MGIFDRNNPNGPGVGGRLLAALFFALIAFFFYMSQVEENPVTGERQHVAISPSQEIRLGLESAPAMSREMGGELSNLDPRTMQVKNMGDLLVSTTIAKKSPWQFQFHLLQDEQTVNAFALPGGQIFITLGLYDRLKTKAQLAGVLSHEMGHVIERHTAQQMAKNQLGQMLVVAVGTAATDSQGGSSTAPAVIASFVNQIIQLRYSRQDESEADLWGVKLMEEAGFDPHAMIEVMEILKEAGSRSQGTPEIFQTHPNPDLRIEQIKEYLKTHPTQKE